MTYTATPVTAPVVEPDCGKTIAADLVIAALGAGPATEWVEDSALDVGVFLDDAG